MSENPIIYIPDLTYDNPDYYPALDKQAASKKFHEQVTDELGVSSYDANIGAGADWPVVALEIIEYIQNKEYLFLVLAAFFSGEKINENLDAWFSIGQKIYSRASKFQPILNRSASILLGLQGYINESKNERVSLELRQYKALDAREYNSLEKIILTKNDIILDEPTEENLGHTIHYFRLNVDGKEIEILSRSVEVIIRGLDEA